MKYIRTKDDIIDFEKVEIVDREIGTPKTIAYLKKNAIKEADTIEELCDVLVNIVYDGHGKPHWEIRCWYDRTWKKDFKNDSDWSIYGAIWTDKGLIYVAKMNENGELELL